MENSQVKDIAVGAMIGHWPAHLGLTTDSEKIEWLARQVERLTDEVDEHDGKDSRLQKKLDISEDRLQDRDELVEDLKICTECQLCDSHKKDVAA